MYLSQLCLERATVGFRHLLLMDGVHSTEPTNGLVETDGLRAFFGGSQKLIEARALLDERVTEQLELLGFEHLYFQGGSLTPRHPPSTLNLSPNDRDSKESAMNYCPHCGASIDGTAAFCSGCGKSLTAAARPTQLVVGAVVALSLMGGIL